MKLWPIALGLGAAGVAALAASKTADAPTTAPKSSEPITDEYSLARMIASEAGGQKDSAMRGVGHAAANYARLKGKTLTALLLGTAKEFGKQGTGGRGYASTSREPTAKIRVLAKEIIAGQSVDPTKGAQKWDSPQSYPAQGLPASKAQEVALSRQSEGYRMVLLDDVPERVIRFWRKA